MEQLYFARALLEGQAAYHAVSTLKESDSKTLEALMDVRERALDRHDYTEFNTANRAFHFTIYAANHNSYIMNMIGSMWDLAERYRFRYMVLRDHASTIQA